MSATRRAASTRAEVTKRIKRSATHKERSSIRQAISSGDWDQLQQSQRHNLRPTWK